MTPELYHRLTQRLLLARQKLEEIVCTSGCDKGVVLLSQDGPCHWDAEQQCQVYDHEYFSELGDALIALWDILDLPYVDSLATQERLS